MKIPISNFGGDDVPMFEPKMYPKFKDIGKSIQELRAIFRTKTAIDRIPKRVYNQN